MSVWVWSAGTGTVIGLTAFFLMLVPLITWQYRSFGRLSVGRLLGAALVSVYGAALLAYTQLPLPETRSLAWCEAYGVHDLQLIPFESFSTMLMRADEIGWLPMLSSTLGMQVIFNVALFVPLGVFMRSYFHASVAVATVTGVCVSVFIEATQATGLWGVYPCAYRLGDIDDLMTNTLGALIGAVFAPLILFWMPKRQMLRQHRLQSRPITAGRRTLAMLLNYGLVWAIGTGVSGVISVVWRLIEGKLNLSLLDWVHVWVHVLTVVCVIFIPAVQGRGSLGMHIVWLRPVWRDRSGMLARGSIMSRIARASVLGVPLMLTSTPGFEGGAALFIGIAGVSLVMVPFTLNHRSFSGWLTRCEIVDTRSSSD